MKAGRLLRAQQRDVDTPQKQRERNNIRKAANQARGETLAKFGQITADNVKEALAFQEARYQELVN
jgi:hypothetical protein